MTDQRIRLREYVANSFTTSGRFKYLHKCLALPEDLDEKVILDIGAGMSDAAVWLRKRGATPIAVDIRYHSLSLLLDSMKPDLRSVVLGRYDLVSNGSNGFKKVWDIFRFGLEHRMYEIESAKAYQDFRHDWDTHPGTYICADAETLPFEDESINYCFSIEALTAFTIKSKSPDPLKNSVLEAMRVLKLGGQMELYPWVSDRSIGWSRLEIQNANQALAALDKYTISEGPCSLLVTKD